MNRAFSILLLSVLTFAASPAYAQRTLERFQYSQQHMGVRVVITCYAANQERAEKACAAAFARFAELDAIMSDYRQDSELMKLCARAGQGPVKVSPELLTVLARARQVSEATEGAFDVTVGPLVQLWRQARRSKQLPPAETFRAARELVGWRLLLLDLDSSTVELVKSGMRLDLGGIAKGYACDEALRVLGHHDVDRAMVEAGGDIACSKSPPGKVGWGISVQGLPQTYFLARGAVSTSGDTEQYVVIAGTRYSHIVDPRTGLGLTNQFQATVFAAEGLTTDPLATAMCVLGAQKELTERFRAKSIVQKK